MNSDLTFLWFKTSKALAWAQKLSPMVDMEYRGQLHLKPQDPKPYIQITRSPTSLPINIEDLDVYLVDCNNEEVEINDHVDIFPYLDTNNIWQIYLRLKYLPLDYGANLVCLKISTQTGIVRSGYYSNPFLLTGLDIDKTVRIDYLETREPYQGLKVFNSVRLRMYRNDYVPGTELTTYYQITKGQNVISRVNKDRRVEWICEKMDSWHWIRLEEALYNSRCYFDFVRNYPAEALAYEPRLGDTNMNYQRVVTDPNETDTINIPSIIIDPEILYVPMLASTDVLASTEQLTSEIETPVL